MRLKKQQVKAVDLLIANISVENNISYKQAIFLILELLIETLKRGK